MRKLLSSCQSIKGNYREKNQDRALCMTSDRKDRIFAVACVCDGIGSFEMSELASKLVTDGVKNWYLNMEKRFELLSLNDLLDDMEETVYELNELVYEYQEQHQIAIGCTMSLMLVVDMRYFIFHVGDSRIYAVEKEMYQLTVDESVQKKKEGTVKSYLSNYMGKAKNLWLNKGEGMIRAGSLYVLGTDGLFKNLQYEDINTLYVKLRTQKEIEIMNNRIVQLVLERGERDNISCILLYLHESYWGR